MMKLYTLGPKAFKRRFNLNRPQFNDFVEKIKHVAGRGERSREGHGGEVEWIVRPRILVADSDAEMACMRALHDVPRGQ